MASERLLVNANYENGVIKSLPRAWSSDDIDNLNKLKSEGVSVPDIAKQLGRTNTSVSIKLKRLTKSDDSYNVAHRDDKYIYNEKFLSVIRPKTVLDVFAGNSFYKNHNGIMVTDNDKDSKFGCTYSMDAFKLLCKMNYDGAKFDIVDLDPFGSAIDCFDLAINIAKKGIIITLGEMGHKRWKRLDFVRRWYDINTLDDFTTDHIILKLQERALCYKKRITPVYIRDYKLISRVWFSIEDIKITEQWERE
jgi:hypothetical protein